MSRISAACAAALVVFASSCGGSTDSGAVTATDSIFDEVTTTSEVTTSTVAPQESSTTTLAAIADTSPADTTPADTVPAPTTTVPPIAVPAPTTATTTGPPSSTPDLVLRFDGIGPFTFGSISAADFAAAVAPALGAPTQFSSEIYPSDEGSYFENIDDESGFTHPNGETVCFANALCAYFGGNSPGAVTFVGYSQDENAASLRTPSGVGSGSIWADFSTSITIDEGACFSTGYGRADGVQIVVLSTGDPFEYFDTETETIVRATPAPADVRVISLHAGDRPFFLYEDC